MGYVNRKSNSIDDFDLIEQLSREADRQPCAPRRSKLRAAAFKRRRGPQFAMQYLVNYFRPQSASRAGSARRA